MTGFHKMYNLRCPLCCGKTFNSKQSLVDHLSSHRANFTCPICQKSYSTITNLINHLNMTTCKPTNLNSIIASADQSLNELAQTKSKKNFDDTTVLPKIESVRSQGNPNINNGDDHEYEDIMKNNHELPELQESNLGATNMYEELLGKDALQGGDLQLLEENGHDRYTIVAHEGLPAIMHNGTLISKQNSDGTISFTSAKDEDEEDEMLKLEPELEPVITVADKDPESNEQELYSCNTCGVSFSSVLEHIQAYHKDQDVVVEVNEQSQIDEVEESQEGERQLNTDDQPLASVALKDNKIDTAEGQPMKRVITDTGAIIEEASFFPIIEVQGKDEEAKAVPLSLLEEEEVFDKKGLVFTRRYVQVEKFNNPDPLKAEEVGTAQSKLPYHQVVIKEIVTMDGGAKMKVYNCVACSVYVTNLDEFKSHPCRLLKYICPHCPVSYDNARSLCAHMKVHKTTKSFAKGPEVPPNEIKEYPVEVFNGPYRCDICTTVFPSNKSLKLHRRMHDPIKARPIEPPVDDNSDPSEDASEKYFCSQCSKWIPVGYRSVHSNFHKSTENFNCDICNKKFSSSSYLAMHMTVHNTEKVKVKKPDKTLPYVCLYCNRQFARPHEKVKHERIHTGEKPHSCEICGKSFRVSYCLTLHMRTHTGARPYACQHCGKRFKAHSVYNHHLLTHSDVRAYKCPFCPKAFKTSVQLAGHKNSHTKPFSCTHCNRPFASLYAVRVHTETHRRQNNLKFSCKSCGASYARSFALKDHMRQIHNQEVDDKDYYVPIAAQNANPSDWAVDSAEEQSDTPPRKDFQEINDLAMSSNESETVMT